MDSVVSVFDQTPAKYSVILGWMCKLCNFVQINPRRILRHVQQQHDLPEGMSSNYAEAITLVANPMNDIIETPYKFVSPTRYECFAKNCPFATNVQHFLNAHVRRHDRKSIGDIICQYCPGGVSIFTTFSEYGNHLHRHGAYIYQCKICSMISYTEQSMLEHLLKRHSDSDKVLSYRHNHRTQDRIFCETVDISLKCVACDITLKNASSAKMHENNCNSTVTIKRAVKRQTQDLTTSVTVSEYPLSIVVYLCCICGHEFYTKEKYFDHNEVDHVGEAILFMLNPNTLDIGCKWTETPLSYEYCDKNIYYLCFHCYDENTQKCERFASAADVYKHWRQIHQVLGHEFRFTVHNTEMCTHCSRWTSMSTMRQHEVMFHGRENYPPPGGTISAIRVDKTTLCGLLKWNLRGAFKCVPCAQRFEDMDQAIQHSNEMHPMIAADIVSYDGAAQDLNVIAACCKEIMPEKKHLTHLEGHEFPHQCYEHDFVTTDLLQHLKHRKDYHGARMDILQAYSNSLRKEYNTSWLVFGNGLLLRRTDLDDINYNNQDKINNFLDVLVTMKQHQIHGA